MVMSVTRAAYGDVAIEYGSRDVGMGRAQGFSMASGVEW
jgi:hypothetical protein